MRKSRWLDARLVAQSTLALGLIAAVAAPSLADKDKDKPAQVTPKKDQPPAVKLKLGHYGNDKRGIGLIVDLTTKDVKARFDGTKETYHLDQINQSSDWVSYGKNMHSEMLRVYKDGHIDVWVPGGDNDSITVKRDGDADPL